MARCYSYNEAKEAVAISGGVHVEILEEDLGIGLRRGPVLSSQNHIRSHYRHEPQEGSAGGADGLEYWKNIHGDMQG